MKGKPLYGGFKLQIFVYGVCVCVSGLDRGGYVHTHIHNVEGPEGRLVTATFTTQSIMLLIILLVIFFFASFTDTNTHIMKSSLPCVGWSVCLHIRAPGRTVSDPCILIPNDFFAYSLVESDNHWHSNTSASLPVTVSTVIINNYLLSSEAVSYVLLYYGCFDHFSSLLIYALVCITF